MNNIIQQIDNSIVLTDQMIVEEPTNRTFPAIKTVLIKLKDEFSKDELDKETIGQGAYGLVRGYQSVLHVEHTPFGKAIGKLLLELQKYD